MNRFVAVLVLLSLSSIAFAQNGYDLWFNSTLKSGTPQFILSGICAKQSDQTIRIAIQEIQDFYHTHGGKALPISSTIKNGNIVLALTSELKSLNIQSDTFKQNDGYRIENRKIKGESVVLITSPSNKGLLYGAYAFIRHVKNGIDLQALQIHEEPKIQRRILNHWDNLDRTVERGYAGFSLWDWQRLPKYIDPRYIDYARANASIGINGTVLNNVNANAVILTAEWLQKVKSLADVFRPYGIQVYLTARFSSPIEIGGLNTADPLDPTVIKWWEEKTKEIYELIPDFGGFLVKANSEGQPGPQNYGRNHADGANLMARALRPFGGIVMWRAFVYDNENKEDRAKQGYSEFKALEGTFDENVIVQVKNGAIDFQPREPFHPLFGAMPKTNVMAELQITQEYLGMATNLAYLAPLFKECLDADTYARGEGATVGKVIDGSLFSHKISAIAGVSNIGTALNWTGHPLAQANWYAFGRLAWDYELSSEDIAKEWITQTFGNDKRVRETLSGILMKSREAVVNYMTPLGLHHIMGWDHHYGPGPWIKDKPRADWTSVYYHQADAKGIGFDRTTNGSDAVSQYAPPVASKFNNVDTCPEEFLLWFHHLPWDYKLKNGQSLWNGIVYKYYQGVEDVKWMQSEWNTLQNYIPLRTFEEVRQLLSIQLDDAIMWRDACVLYFQQFSKQPIPNGLEKPKYDLKYYENLEFKFVPGI